MPLRNAVLHLQKQAFDSQLCFRIEMQRIKRHGCVADSHEDRERERETWMAVAPVYGGERRRHRTWPRMRMSTNRKMYGFHTARCRVKRENSRIRLVEVEQQNNRRTAHNAE